MDFSTIVIRNRVNEVDDKHAHNFKGFAIAADNYMIDSLGPDECLGCVANALFGKGGRGSSPLLYGGGKFMLREMDMTDPYVFSVALENVKLREQIESQRKTIKRLENQND